MYGKNHGGGGYYKTESDVFKQTFESARLLVDELEENYEILQTKQWRLQMVYEIAQNDFGQCEIGATDVQERILYKAGTTPG